MCDFCFGLIHWLVTELFHSWYIMFLDPCVRLTVRNMSYLIILGSGPVLTVQKSVGTAEAWRFWGRQMAFSLWLIVHPLPLKAECTHRKFPQLLQQLRVGGGADMSTTSGFHPHVCIFVLSLNSSLTWSCCRRHLETKPECPSRRALLSA